MTQLINVLSQQIGPKAAGIVWLTDDSLTLETKGLYEINYLFNGLLIKSIINSTANADNDFYFLSKSFGKDFFLSQVSMKRSNPLLTASEHLSLSKNSLGEHSHVFIISYDKPELAKDFQKKLSKGHPNLNFDVLSITN